MSVVRCPSAHNPRLTRRGPKMLMKAANENPISDAFGVEGNSGMPNRGDLADLTAFIAVADELSFRAAALRLGVTPSALRSEEHTSELQSHLNLVCRLLLEKK